MSEKLTIGEQAEKQTNAFIGAEFCIECDEIIPIDRRKAYNSNKCIDCATFEETLAKR